MNTGYVSSQGVVQIEHPERVNWYSALIQEWTGQAPLTVVVDGVVAAWVMGYHSQAGVVHMTPTQVWALTTEQALEDLANQVYRDVQSDLTSLVQGIPQPLVGQVSLRP